MANDLALDYGDVLLYDRQLFYKKSLEPQKQALLPAFPLAKEAIRMRLDTMDTEILATAVLGSALSNDAKGRMVEFYLIQSICNCGLIADYEVVGGMGLVKQLAVAKPAAVKRFYGESTPAIPRPTGVTMLVPLNENYPDLDFLHYNPTGAVPRLHAFQVAVQADPSQHKTNGIPVAAVTKHGRSSALLVRK